MAMELHKLRGPRYFIAVFGDPVGPPLKDKIEDGRYIPHRDHWPDGMMEGDVMLLYCTGSYGEYDQEAPGIGIALRTDRHVNAIYYRYLPFDQTMSMDDIRDRLLPADREKFENRRFSTFWICEIEGASFRQLTQGHQVTWP